MITASLPETQKRPHESDNSNSDKEAPLNSVAQYYGTSLDHLALVVKDVEPTSSSGWIDVRKKKKVERILPDQHNDPVLSPYIVMFHLALPTHSMGLSFSIG
jgi:hypothetical protein